MLIDPKRIATVGDLAFNIANSIHRRLNLHTKYRGPVVTAGGFWRDRLFGKHAKDMDIFLRYSDTDNFTLQDFTDIAKETARSLGIPVFGIRCIPCYNEWAYDISMLLKVDPGSDEELALDIVFLDGKDYSTSDFLGHCLNRFDVRLNSIGADATQWACNHALSLDIQAERLVVHWERMPLNERMRRRLQYLSSDAKYPGWSIWVETDDTGNEIIEYDPINDMTKLK